MKNPFSDFWLRMPADFVRALLARLVLLLVFSGALALTWWSVNRLQPVERKLQMQTDKLARLEDDVMQLELKWNPREAEQVTGKFKQAQEQVFAGHEEFLRWQEELKRQPNQFVLEVKAEAVRTQACSLPNKIFAVIPTTIDMQVSDETATQPPFKRLLDFAQNLTTQKKRVDLMELTVSGNSNSVSQARLGVQVWSQENSRTP